MSTQQFLVVNNDTKRKREILSFCWFYGCTWNQFNFAYLTYQVEQSVFWCTSSLCYTIRYDTKHCRFSRNDQENVQLVLTVEVNGVGWVPSFRPFSWRTESATLTQSELKFSAAISSAAHCMWCTTPFVNSTHTHNPFWENVGQLHLKFHSMQALHFQLLPFCMGRGPAMIVNCAALGDIRLWNAEFLHFVVAWNWFFLLLRWSFVQFLMELMKCILFFTYLLLKCRIGNEWKMESVCFNSCETCEHVHSL